MFNHQELVAIMKICDAGVRAGGLEIAEIAMPIVYKIRQSMLARPDQGPPHLRQVEPQA